MTKDKEKELDFWFEPWNTPYTDLVAERNRLLNVLLEYRKLQIFPHWNLPDSKNPLIIKNNTK